MEHSLNIQQVPDRKHYSFLSALVVQSGGIASHGLTYRLIDTQPMGNSTFPVYCSSLVLHNIIMRKCRKVKWKTDDGKAMDKVNQRKIQQVIDMPSYYIITALNKSDTIKT